MWPLNAPLPARRFTTWPRPAGAAGDTELARELTDSTEDEVAEDEAVETFRREWQVRQRFFRFETPEPRSFRDVARSRLEANLFNTLFLDQRFYFRRLVMGDEYVEHTSDEALAVPTTVKTLLDRVTDDRAVWLRELRDLIIEAQQYRKVEDPEPDFGQANSGIDGSPRDTDGTDQSPR